MVTIYIVLNLHSLKNLFLFFKKGKTWINNGITQGKYIEPELGVYSHKKMNMNNYYTRDKIFQPAICTVPARDLVKWAL